MGRRAATLLLSKVADPDYAEPLLVLPVALRDGHSIRTISPASQSTHPAKQEND
jgi:hypothetical protein